MSSVDTARLRLVPLTTAFADRYDARECRAAEEHWRRHGFGHWAVLERETDELVGAAEVHFAYPGVEGISTDEVELGFEILPAHRGRGYAVEAVLAAVSDVWRRTDVDHLAAYTRPDHAVSIHILGRAGFAFASAGVDRHGDPVSIYALRRSGRGPDATWPSGAR